MTLLASHFERIQRRLAAEGDAARSFQHGLNRGQIREAFIREFLAQNISDFWGIGTGEIIHKDALPEESRHQIDVVVHNKKFPKLSLATGIDLFFVETISSFIEIKSRLTKDSLRKAIAVTKGIKGTARFPRQRVNPMGLVPAPRPYSFVFAYEGPKRIETVLKWMKDISMEDDYGLDALMETEPTERFLLRSPVCRRRLYPWKGLRHPRFHSIREPGWYCDREGSESLAKRNMGLEQGKRATHALGVDKSD